jgi:hypothetical protein
MKNSLNTQTDFKMLGERYVQRKNNNKAAETETITSFEMESSILPISIPISTEEQNLRDEIK